MNDDSVRNKTTPIAMQASAQATRPTGFTVFLRTFVPWQFVRFLVINLKMIRMTRINERAR